MSNLNAPVAGGTVRGTNAADLITGSANADVLWGNGGNDVINGGDGNDVIEGDGVYTVADAVNATGTAVFSNLSLISTTSLLPALASMGVAANGQTVWRLRNTSNVAETVVFESTSKGNGSFGPVTYVIPAHSDLLVTSPNPNTHKLYFNGAQMEVKSSGNQAFTYATALETVVDGNDALSGGNGNDTIRGWGGDDILNGDAGDDSLDGGTGNDKLAGGAGADYLNGGDGIDTADYSTSSAAVDVNLERGTGLGGDAQGDTLINIENLTGSNFADVLTGNSGANILRAGAGNDLLVGSGGGDIMDGGADVDTVDYSASTAGVQVNLVTGLGAGGFAAGDTLISIENLVGSNFADVLTGNTGANILRAGAGNDVLVGSGGGDIMDGGTDVDTADYSASIAGVTVSLVTGLGIGGFAAGDTLISIENLVGSKFNDVLTGDAGANVISGGAGVDLVVGGAGADSLNGGADIDTVTYVASTAGVTVNLGLGTGLGGDAEGDALSGFENLIGSNFADILFGDAGKNTISGGTGNDHLYGTGGGDTFDGGAGLDWIDYRNSTAAVTVNLATGVGSGGFAQGDTYINIEDIRGSKFGDTLIGNDTANVIYAGAGTDIISGGGGNDMIYSGGGYDIINGGAGTDTLSYVNSWASVVASLATGVGAYGEASRDTITGIENLVGSKFDDTLTGDAGVNRLTGGAGADALNGGAGDDTLIGGKGGDTLNGGDGQDTANYAAALDAVTLNMATGGTGGDAAGDSFVSIEQIVGSAFNDVITGNAGDNRFDGGAGNDTIDGAGGIDYLYGNLGNDLLTGGTGADVFVFTRAFGNDTITDFWFGVGRTDRVQLVNTDLHSFADILSHAVNSADGVVLSVDAGVDHITFTGVTLAQLNADDFLFS